MDKDTAKLHYDFMMAELASNKTLSRKTRDNYKTVTNRLRWHFGF
jgi:hypothetical protein